MARGKPKPIVEEMEFIKCWNKHNGDAVGVAQELGMKYNSAWVRGSRLLKKHGIKGNVSNSLFEMNFEKLESENAGR